MLSKCYFHVFFIIIKQKLFSKSVLFFISQISVCFFFLFDKKKKLFRIKQMLFEKSVLLLSKYIQKVNFSISRIIIIAISIFLAASFYMKHFLLIGRYWFQNILHLRFRNKQLFIKNRFLFFNWFCFREGMQWLCSILPGFFNGLMSDFFLFL